MKSTIKTPPLPSPKIGPKQLLSHRPFWNIASTFWTVEVQAPYLQVWAQNKNTLHQKITSKTNYTSWVKESVLIHIIQKQSIYRPKCQPNPNFGIPQRLQYINWLPNDMKLLVLITLHSIKTQFNIYCHQFIEHTNICNKTQSKIGPKQLLSHCPFWKLASILK